jgi:periplasmic divalent cation tolerance protein
VEPTKHIAMVTTVGNLAEAQSMARAVVERKLAACAQISEIESFYTWNDAVQHEKEFRVLFKTTRDCYQAVEDAIRELHSYELPAIHAFPLAEIYAPYAAWIEANSNCK